MSGVSLRDLPETDGKTNECRGEWRCRKGKPIEGEKVELVERSSKERNDEKGREI